MNIRSQIQRDFESTKPTLIKKVLADKEVNKKEYDTLKKHYSGGDKKKELEFEAAFRSFAKVNLGVSKKAEFGVKSVSFPGVPSAAPGANRTRPNEKAGSIPQVIRLPQVIKPVEAYRLDSQKYLENKQFWPFMKNMQEAPESLRGELLNDFKKTVGSIFVNDEKNYHFSKNALSSAKSIIGTQANHLQSEVKAYEAFTGRDSAQTHVINNDTKSDYVDVLAKKVRGKQTDILSVGGGNFGLVNFLRLSSPPAVDAGEGTSLEKLVNSEQDGKSSILSQLSDKLLQHPKEHLTPQDVISDALDVTGGDLPLANLAVHNLLKNIAYSGFVA